MNNKVIIYGNKDYWNWRYIDGLCDIPIFGKTFKTKEETIKNFKAYAFQIGIKNYLIEEEANNMTLQEQIIQIITEEVGSGVTLETVVLNASALEENTGREIILKLEDEFDIEIPDKEAEKLHTVKDVVEYVTEAIKKSGEAEKESGEE